MSSKASRLALAAGLGLSLSLAWSGSARAATLTVTDLGDGGSPGQLRTLMNAAAPSDTIVIPAGTITLTGAAGEDLNAGGDLDVRKDLTIQGAGAGLTIVDGGAFDGVFDVLNPNRLTLSGVTIRNGAREANVGSPQAGGGGIRNFGTLELVHAVVSGNQAVGRNSGDFHFGGGIRNLGTLTLTDVTIVGNHARGGGGGVYNELGAVVTLTDVTVSGNTVEINGAGISNLGTATLTNVTVSGNNADQNGGGIFNAGAVVSAATATLTNVTVSGNHAVGLGGGMYNSATATLTNVTVSGNGTASLAAGGGIRNFGSAALKNVLLGGNSAGAGDGNCAGAFTSLGHNLDSGTTCGLTAAGDLSSAAPNLGPLQDNGGLTFTHALLAGSPAIDAGTNDGCPSTDQRGAPRPQGPSCDIGAYELGTGVMITPPGATVPPKGAVSFRALGGSGTGFTWSLATNASGGSIGAANGVYAAGATGGVTDVVQATDSLGNTATANVAVTAGVSIAPATVSVAPRGGQTFSASGGSGTGFAWSLATNASGGSIGAATGVYTAGATGDVTDVVHVADSLGNTATRSVAVTAGVSISPTSASVAPQGSQTFSAFGGCGTGFAWSLATNASGGSIGAATGVYTAGPTGSVTDVVQVADSLGNTATRSVAVTAGVSISPTSASVAPRGSQAFSASGGCGTGFAWSLATNASGGSIDATTGVYTAGATGDVTDVVQVTDSLGNTATVDVVVTAGVAPASEGRSGCGCGTGPQPSLVVGLAVVALLTWRRRSNRAARKPLE